MKSQWGILFGLLFAIIVAVFAVFNVDKVPVNYVFGEAQWPLVLVILGAALLGALLSISFASYKIFGKSRQRRQLQKELDEANARNQVLQTSLDSTARDLEQLKANSQSTMPIDSGHIDVNEDDLK